MKKTLLLLSLVSIVSFGSFGQHQGDGGTPLGFKVINPKTIVKKTFAEPDINALRIEDELVENTSEGPWRFGFNNEVSLKMDETGTWTNLPNGGKVWNLMVECKNALTVNLTFENVVLPEGNELYVYNEDKTFILGKFTAYHLYEGVLGTELVPGSKAIVEYYVAPQNSMKKAGLELTRVTHGYRTANEFIQKAFGSSGGCNMNVNCPDGTAWIQQKRGAIMLVSGSNGFCSGSMINNTQNDGKPYVLTANHCYSNPANWIFRFNWESADCNNPASSPSFVSLSGAVLRSRRTPSDFCLVEITGGLVNNTVPASYQTYFSGWDNSGVNPTSTVSIHHPAGDIKKISFDDDAASAVQAMGSSEASSSWQVSWDRSTTTEGGSSGSPLFDQNHRIIGQLWGGGASCANLSAPDYYGRLYNSWEPSGSNSTNQLKFWLDPNGIGATVIDGYDPMGPTAALDASVGSVNGASGVVCGDAVTPEVTVVNFGTDVLTSATIMYGYDGVEDQTYNWTGSLAQYDNDVVTLPMSTLPNGNHTFSATISSPNNGTDANAANNATNSSFVITANGSIVTLNLDLDCYGSETGWQVSNTVSGVLYTSPGYSDGSPGIVNADFCLADGCYNFTITDSYGDGLTSCSQANGGSGSYQIVDDNATVLTELLEADANFGNQLIQQFCVGANGLTEASMESRINMFPNPATTELTIKGFDVNIESLTIYDVMGKMVQNETVNNESITVNVHALNSGVYTVKISTAEGVAVKNLIIK